MERKKPSLIQRLSRHSGPYLKGTRTGVDKYFGFEYMGSAEFEFGALTRALQSMRKAVVSGPTTLKVGEYVAWFVGTSEYVTVATALFEDQLGPREWWLKERSCILQAYKEPDEWMKTSGWWAIDQPVPWLLFQKKDDAKLWLKLLKEGQKS